MNTTSPAHLVLPGWRFLRVIGKCKFLLILSRDHIFSNINDPSIYSQRCALLQKWLFRCLCSVHSLLKTMCSKLSLSLDYLNSNNLFHAPFTISLCPPIMRKLASESLGMLSKLNTDFIRRGPPIFKNNSRVHFYTYVLSRIATVLDSVLDSSSFIF